MTRAGGSGGSGGLGSTGRPVDRESAIFGRLMLAFEGTRLPLAIARRLADAPAAGITLFRWSNVESPGQLRELIEALQAAASRGARRRGEPDAPPVLIAADQEGGQLVGLGDGPTVFAGNMALGAAGDADLAERVGRATGLELAAMGVTVNYAPVVDVATNPANPAIGIRSFGDDPAAVGALAAATIRGLRSAGVAATAKHFPGLGDVAADTHHGLAVVGHDRSRLEAVELAPFRAAIAAGVDLVMSGHVAVPALSGDPTLPATLSRPVMDGLLRRTLGFRGVSISDALDMRALAQGPGQVVDVLAALAAGVDLLLCTPDPRARRRIENTLRRAAARALFRGPVLDASARRIDRLRRRVGRGPAVGRRPDLTIVGSAAHLALAREVAERSVTLVRDDARLLPIRPSSGARVAAIMPRPRDLTPADTSSGVAPGLAAALRATWPGVTVDELVTGHPPTDAEIAGLRARVAEVDLVVVGTIEAARDPAQAELVETLLATGRPVVTVALRTPYDLAAYPRATTHLATYSILAEPLTALGAILAGRLRPVGRLPVDVPGVAARGHGGVE
jgi:beta-N-acetylhexosaminidase